MNTSVYFRAFAIEIRPSSGAERFMSRAQYIKLSSYESSSSEQLSRVGDTIWSGSAVHSNSALPVREFLDFGATLERLQLRCRTFYVPKLTQKSL